MSAPSSSPKPEPGWIYLAYTKELQRTAENIYKIGRTSNPNKRYASATLLLSVFPVSDQVKAENDLLALFRGCSSFVNRKDVGREYFQGDFVDMHALFSTFCQTTVVDRKLRPDEIACPMASVLPDSVDNTASLTPEPPTTAEPVMQASPSGPKKYKATVKVDHSYIIHPFMEKYLGNLTDLSVNVDTREAFDAYNSWMLTTTKQKWIAENVPDSSDLDIALTIKPHLTLAAFTRLVCRTFPLFKLGTVVPPGKGPLLQCQALKLADKDRGLNTSKAQSEQSEPTNKLLNFLKMGPKERGWAIKHYPGKITWVADFKQAFKDFTGGEDVDVYQQRRIFHQLGFKIPAGPKDREHVCLSCKQLARGRGKKCCSEYNAAHRTKKTVIVHMAMTRLPNASPSINQAQ